MSVMTTRVIISATGERETKIELVDPIQLTTPEWSGFVVSAGTLICLKSYRPKKLTCGEGRAGGFSGLGANHVERGRLERYAISLNDRLPTLRDEFSVLPLLNVLD